MGSTTKRMSPASEAWVLMGRLLVTHKRRLHACAAEFELSPPQAMALKSLSPAQAAPMSWLAEQLHCDNSNVTGIVDRLERRGLVERRPAAHDRRVKHVVLTPDGVALRDEIAARVDRAPEALEALSPDDQRALRDLLARALADQA
jgi:DNA-binding MarR family transcriptional regulator